MNILKQNLEVNRDKLNHILIPYLHFSYLWEYWEFYLRWFSYYFVKMLWTALNNNQSMLQPWASYWSHIQVLPKSDSDSFSQISQGWLSNAPC